MRASSLVSSLTMVPMPCYKAVESYHSFFYPFSIASVYSHFIEIANEIDVGAIDRTYRDWHF
jgi:hypothetical protein